MAKNTKETIQYTPAAPTDAELTDKIKKDKDVEESLNLLINRHSALFSNVFNKYQNYTPTASGFNSYLADVKDDKATIFYNAALKYDKDRNMKFSSYLGQTLNFICLKTLNNKKLNNFPTDDETINSHLESKNKENKKSDITLDYIQEILEKLGDKRIAVIFKERYLNHDKTPTWAEIGEKLGLSKPWVSMLHSKGLEKIKEKLSNKNY